MKQFYVQCLLTAALLAVIVVPVVDNGAKAAGQRNSRTTIGTQPRVAEAGPTPWPKKPVVGEMPTVVAEGFPIPWPKKPVVGEMPTVVAEGTPTPWPNGPPAPWRGS